MKRHNSIKSNVPHNSKSWMHQIIRLKGIVFIKEGGAMVHDKAVETKKASKRKKARKNPNSIWDLT